MAVFYESRASNIQCCGGVRGRPAHFKSIVATRSMSFAIIKDDIMWFIVSIKGAVFYCSHTVRISKLNSRPHVGMLPSTISEVGRLYNYGSMAKDPRIGPHVKNVFPLSGAIGHSRKTVRTIGNGTCGRVNAELFPEGEVATKYFTSDETMCENTTEIAALKLLQGQPHVAQLIRVESKPVNTANVNAITPSIVKNLAFPAVIMGKARTDLTDRSLYTSWDSVFSIIKQVLIGYTVLHSNHLAHRDTKPGNMLMTATGEVWITDFGMARYLPPHASMPQDGYIGTAIFAAPELLLQTLFFPQRKRFDFFKSDAWAVGASLFNIITGKYLVYADTPEGIVTKLFELYGTPTAEDGEVFVLFEARVKKNPRAPMAAKKAVPRRSELGPIAEKVLELAVHKPRVRKLLEEVAMVIEGLCTYNPDKRLSVQKALEHLQFITFEKMLPVLPVKNITQQYMNTSGLPPDVHPKMLDILLNWLFDVAVHDAIDHQELSPFVLDRTGGYTMAFLNKFKNHPFTTRKNLQLIGIAGFYLACCFFGNSDPTIDEMIHACAGAYDEIAFRECLKMYMSIDLFGKTFLDEVLENEPVVDDEYLQTYGLLNFACFQKHLFPKDSSQLLALRSLFKQYADGKQGKLSKMLYLTKSMNTDIYKPGLDRVNSLFHSFVDDVNRLFTTVGGARKRGWDGSRKTQRRRRISKRSR